MILTFGFTEHPISAPYVRGKLALAGIDLSADLGTWLDAVYAVWIDAPHELLEKANAQMVRTQARIRPEEARETWGMRPEHRAMAGRLGTGRGAESGVGQAPAAGPTRNTEEAVQAWAAQQARARPGRPGR